MAKFPMLYGYSSTLDVVNREDAAVTDEQIESFIDVLCEEGFQSSDISIAVWEEEHAVFIDLFSRESHEADMVRELAEKLFGGTVRHMNTFQRRS